LSKSERKNSHLALLGAAHSLNHSLFAITPPLLTMILSSLNVAKSEIGLVATIASFIYGAGALVGGPLGDRIGEAWTITISLAFSGSATFIMLAAEATQAIYIYAFALIMMATWASLYHPTANSLISKTFKDKMSESMGLHGVGGTVGVVLTPTIAYAIGVGFGWSLAFVFFGFLCIITAVFVIKGFRKNGGKRGRSGTILDALKIRQLWMLLVFNVAIGLFMKGIELFFPTYLVESRGISPEWAALAYTLVLAAGVPAQWLGGKAADKIGSRKVLIATSFGVVVSLVCLLFLPVRLIGVAVFIVAYGFSFYAHQPALNSLTGVLSPRSHRGAVYGVFFFTSFGLGSVSQLAAGIIGDLYGLDVAFYMLTGIALAALLLSLKLPDKTGKRHPDENSVSESD
jgi:MFS family permease